MVWLILFVYFVMLPALAVASLVIIEYCKYLKKWAFPSHGKNAMYQKALNPIIHDKLFYYHPEEKINFINFVDVLHLCTLYEVIRQDLVKNNDKRTKSRLLPCRNPILLRKRECVYCCKNTLEHLEKIYEDISVIKTIAQGRQHKFIQELFGKNFILPEIPIAIIGKYMTSIKPYYISPPECLPHNPYIFESDPYLTKLYRTYSCIFAGLGLACSHGRFDCDREENVKEFFGNIKFQKLSYSQIICKCNKKRLQIRPVAAPYQTTIRSSSKVTLSCACLSSIWNQRDIIHEI